MNAAAIIALVNGLIPLATNIVMLFKNQDGTSTVVISSAQTATASDIQAMQQYLAQHQAIPTTTKPA